MSSVTFKIAVWLYVSILYSTRKNKNYTTNSYKIYINIESCVAINYNLNLIGTLELHMHI